MSRMSWWQLLNVAKKASCADAAFIEKIREDMANLMHGVHTGETQEDMANLMHGVHTDESGHAKSFWL